MFDEDITDDLSLFGDVDASIGKVVAEKYQIVELLVESNSYLVYAAKNLLTNNIPSNVVLKKARSSLQKKFSNLTKKDFQSLNEISSLTSPYLVDTYEYFKFGEDYYQISQLLRDVEGLDKFTKNVEFSKPNLIRLINQICDGLNYLHKYGKVHGWLKPSNILIQNSASQEFNVKLNDFYVNKFILETNKESEMITLTKDKLADSFYLSPEFLEGRGLTTQSDIFSLGCIIYEFITKQKPISMTDKSTNILPTELTRNNNFMQRIESLITCCISERPQDRYKTTLDIKNDLALALVSSDEVWITKSFAKANLDVTSLRLTKVNQNKTAKLSYKPPEIKPIEIKLDKIIVSISIFLVVVALVIFGYYIVSNQDYSYKKFNTTLLFASKVVPGEETGNFDDEIEKNKINLQEVIDECGVNNLQQANALLQLGGSFYKAGKYAEAAANYEQASQIAQKIGNNNLYLMSLYSLANTAYKSHDFNKCKQYCEAALNTPIASANPNDPGLNGLYTLLGNVYIYLNDKENALKEYKLLYRILYRQRFRYPVEFVITGFRYGDLERQLKNYAEAESILKYALGFWNFKIRQEDERLMFAYYSLSIVLVSEKKYDEAIKSLDICKQILKKTEYGDKAFKSSINHYYQICLWNTNVFDAIKNLFENKTN